MSSRELLQTLQRTKTLSSLNLGPANVTRSMSMMSKSPRKSPREKKKQKLRRSKTLRKRKNKARSPRQQEMIVSSTASPSYDGSDASSVPSMATVKNGNAKVTYANLPKMDKRLLQCVLRDDISELTLLIDANGDPNLNKLNEWTPLTRACYEGKYNMARFLVSKGADPELIPGNGVSAVYRAAWKGHFPLVKWLIEECEVDPNMGGDFKLLNAALSTQHEDLATYLVAHGAEVEKAADSTGKTPLHRAAGKGDAELVTWLIENGLSINALDASGRAPIHFACSKGHADVVKTLLDHGAIMSSRSNFGTPAQIAEKNGFDDILNMLKTFRLMHTVPSESCDISRDISPCSSHARNHSRVRAASNLTSISVGAVPSMRLTESPMPNSSPRLKISNSGQITIDSTATNTERVIHKAENITIKCTSRKPEKDDIGAEQLRATLQTEHITIKSTSKKDNERFEKLRASFQAQQITIESISKKQRRSIHQAGKITIESKSKKQERAIHQAGEITIKSNSKKKERSIHKADEITIASVTKRPQRGPTPKRRPNTPLTHELANLIIEKAGEMVFETSRQNSPEHERVHSVDKSMLTERSPGPISRARKISVGGKEIPELFMSSSSRVPHRHSSPSIPRVFGKPKLKEKTPDVNNDIRALDNTSIPSMSITRSLSALPSRGATPDRIFRPRGFPALPHRSISAKRMVHHRIASLQSSTVLERVESPERSKEMDVSMTDLFRLQQENERLYAHLGKLLEKDNSSIQSKIDIAREKSRQLRDQIIFMHIRNEKMKEKLHEEDGTSLPD